CLAQRAAGLCVGAAGRGRRRVLPAGRQGQGRLAGLCLLPQGPRCGAQRRGLPQRSQAERPCGVDAESSELAATPDEPWLREVRMNEDVFNESLRKFLKTVGVTSQREIEKSVREALANGRLKGHESLQAKMVLTIGEVSLSHDVSGS